MQTDTIKSSDQAATLVSPNLDSERATIEKYDSGYTFYRGRIQRRTISSSSSNYSSSSSSSSDSSVSSDSSSSDGSKKAKDLEMKTPEP